jgi:hypothetical protein
MELLASAAVFLGDVLEAMNRRLLVKRLQLSFDGHLELTLD